MATKYVIRKQDFAYTDEYYFASLNAGGYFLNKIIQVFDDAKLAQQAYRQILLESLRKPDALSKFEPEFRSEFDAFIQDQLGEQFSDYLYEYSAPPDQLDDELLLGFAYRTGWLPYVLLSFDDSYPMYAVWVFSQQKYLMLQTDSEYDIPIIVGENGCDLPEETFCIGFSNRLQFALSSQPQQPATFSRQKADEELSNYPLLHKHLASIPDREVLFDAEQEIFVYTDVDPKTREQQRVHTRNLLLKEPIYELHPIRPDQIKQVFENPTVRIA